METKMQTSFIPKKPVTETESSDSGISLFLLLAIIVFIVSIAAAGGVWIWKNSLVSKIEEDKIALVAEKSKYEEKTINDLIRLDDRINVANILLKKHIAVSPVFSLLEENILKNVRLKNLKFTYGTDDKVKIELAGTAQSYEVLSKQGDYFGASELREIISQPVITDFSPNIDGTVSFNFNALVYPSFISYSSNSTSTNN